MFYQVKKTPQPLYEMAVKSADANYRSLQKELLARLQQSFDLDYAGVMGLHQEWINEAYSERPGHASIQCSVAEHPQKGFGQGAKSQMNSFESNMA